MTASNLVKWRRAAETGFAFDPSKGVDPQDIAAVKADIAKARADLLTRIGQAAGILPKAAGDAKAFRTRLDRQYAAWTAYRQAGIGLKDLGLARAAHPGPGDGATAAYMGSPS
ncbi:hypothetical protein [Methylobacterium sp. ARG-1]|uniref:hypothetical protein n=1 Tax=Methylobacterium sp. ARG-1 TaxID=1692501 RepID=UPI00067FF834|nr:hypothetical protein [Methylobacterium sp. ARG-1]KNY20351.1 hypothetical protein AKJ13_23025 [Methylobacterium sp. ARG-1]